jgi:hypothetical protein
MTGNEAAKVIGDMCKRKRHLVSNMNPKEFLVCSECREIQDELRAKDRSERLPLSTASVFLVIDPATGRVGAKMDETEAIKAAETVKGVAVSWPVWIDCRDTPVEA